MLLLIHACVCMRDDLRYGRTLQFLARCVTDTIIDRILCGIVLLVYDSPKFSAECDGLLFGIFSAENSQELISAVARGEPERRGR